MKMKRTKAGVMAVVAALAIGAVASSTASAGDFEAASYPATVTGEQTSTMVFTGAIGTWQCKKLQMQGLLEAKSSKLNLAPLYTECSRGGGFPVTTSMEGCTYEFLAGETIEGSETKVAATMAIRCPAGKEVKLTLNGSTCTLWFPEQEGLGSVTLEDNLAAEPDKVKLALALSGIEYKVVGGLSGCPNKPKDGTYTNGTLSGEVTLGAFTTEGAPINFGVS